MAVYVNDEGMLWNGELWYLLQADDLSELHRFAGRLGLDRRAFNRDGLVGYSIIDVVRDAAIKGGARVIGHHGMLGCAMVLRQQIQKPKKRY